MPADPNIHHPYMRLSLPSCLRAAAEQLQLDVDDINEPNMPTSISAAVISSWRQHWCNLEHWKTQVLTYAIFYPDC